MNKLKIYVASKTRHAAKWKALRDKGYNIISTWIDEAGPGETKDFNNLWTRCVDEVSECDVLLLYREPGEELKGAWVELGCALSRGIPVFAVGIEGFSVSRYYTGVTNFYSLKEAIKAIDSTQVLMN